MLTMSTIWPRNSAKERFAPSMAVAEKLQMGEFSVPVFSGAIALVMGHTSQVFFWRVYECDLSIVIYAAEGGESEFVPID
uniref:Uncharacterized protein n=1 Tax=mine drainage metagenome TaxID=410659 RepID=E6QP12_9ZZZZ